MTAQLTPVSGCGGKGPACFLVEMKDVRVMLDLGYGPQPDLWPNVSGVGRVDALLLSHSHSDHAGALKLLGEIGNPPVYATDIVRRLLPDAVATRGLPLHGSADICGMRVRTGRSGHAPGGIWIHLDVGGGVLYMGDNSSESALYASDPPPPARTIIVDASYGAYDASREESLPAFDRLFDAGPVLLPVPAAGRGPEIALHLWQTRGTYAYIDDAVRAALADLAGDARACVRAEVLDDVARLAREAPAIEDARGVMLAGRGDAAGGLAGALAARWEKKTSPAIVFTGYLPPGTPAESLTHSGRATYMRWNVHPRLSDNAKLVRDTRAATVLPAFGDAKHLPAWEEAFRPARVTLQGPVAL